MTQPNVSVIIPTFRRGEVLLQTIEDLLKQDISCFEIVVVDQTPPCEHPSQVSKKLSELAAAGKIRWLTLSVPRVYAARNYAAAHSCGRILLFLDDDVRLFPGFVRSHLINYDDPSIDAVAGCGLAGATDMGEIPSKPVSRFDPTFEQRLGHAPAEIQAYCIRLAPRNRVRGISWCAAGNFSVRRQAFEAVNGWDEHILNYGDRDMAVRLSKAGFRIDFDPDAPIWHLTYPTGGARMSDRRNPLRSWERCVSIFYGGWRHLGRYPKAFITFTIFHAARFSFLSKRNALRPWRWVPEVLGFCWACIRAKRWADCGPVTHYWTFREMYLRRKSESQPARMRFRESAKSGDTRA